MVFVAILGIDYALLSFFRKQLCGSAEAQSHNTEPLIKNPSSVITSDVVPNPSASINEDELWANALNEVDGKSRNTGLWARCFAQSDGDESTAKAQYIKLRFAMMYEDAVADAKLASPQDSAEVGSQKTIGLDELQHEKNYGPVKETSDGSIWISVGVAVAVVCALLLWLAMLGQQPKRSQPQATLQPDWVKNQSKAIDDVRSGTLVVGDVRVTNPATESEFLNPYRTKYVVLSQKQSHLLEKSQSWWVSGNELSIKITNPFSAPVAKLLLVLKDNACDAQASHQYLLGLELNKSLPPGATSVYKGTIPFDYLTVIGRGQRCAVITNAVIEK